MANEEKSILHNTTHCWCGVKRGKHCLDFELLMKEFCVVCGDKIKAQSENKYFDKGNYRDSCNGKCNVKHSSFNEDLIINNKK